MPVMADLAMWRAMHLGRVARKVVNLEPAQNALIRLFAVEAMHGLFDRWRWTAICNHERGRCSVS
jgi:hypothetical protein